MHITAFFCGDGFVLKGPSGVRAGAALRAVHEELVKMDPFQVIGSLLMGQSVSNPSTGGDQESRPPRRLDGDSYLEG